MGIRALALWVKTDDKDKYEQEPNGAFMLTGNFDIEIPADVTFHAGQKVGVAIRRNKFKTDPKQPDYYGELYTMKEQSGGGA
ncbi:MAG: hypothetical protein KKB59_10375 [Spirochaetes bacterium]|nr:hypothetical protein [Spirochaetota bacterium]